MKSRFYSLDIFRGATVALMILVNNPGNWSYLYSPLDHASWHGCTPTDLVFPFFLFAVGNSVAFGMPSLREGSSLVFLRKLLKRAFLIYLIGILLNWSPFVRWDHDHLVFKSLENIRVFGVLQRIAIAYMIAGLMIYFLSFFNLLISLVVILVGYWIACIVFGQPGSPFSLEGFWGTGLDRKLLGPNHIYKGEGVPFDPEGLVSTIGAIAQVIVGYIAGRYVTSKPLSYEITTRLFFFGALSIFIGFSWDLFFPINKKIWTSSYVIYTSGIAMIILACLIYIVEIKKIRGSLASFFEVFGKNPLFIFVLSGFLPRLLALIRIPTGDHSITSPFGWFYSRVCEPLFSSAYNSSLFYAICMVAFFWAIAFLMDKKRIYIKV